jgi:aminopeptidase N
MPFLSARYAVQKDRWQDVDLAVYYHPAHTVNIDRIVRSMKASLEYFSKEFGRYQFKELRVVEFPRYASFARAHPHTIAFSEGGAFLTRVDEGDIDRTFFVIAHETAHQWWGNELHGARMEGVALLSETLAQYGAIMVLEQTYGADHARRFVEYEMQRYWNGRTEAAEPPLLRVADQSHLFYHKGAVAMYTLREQIGAERVNAALRRFLDKHRDNMPPFATSLDLYGELWQETPDTMRYLLRDLFESVTLWDVAVDSSHAEPTGPNEYRVTMFIRAQKFRVDTAWNEIATPMNDLIEIGVFSEMKDWHGKDLYLGRQRVKNGAQTITLTVRGKPARVAIDPYYKLFQRKISDNFTGVAVQEPPP